MPRAPVARQAPADAAEWLTMWLDDLRPLQPGPPAAGSGLSADAFHPFGLAVAGESGLPVVERVRAHLPFGLLRTFACPGVPVRPTLVVPPLAGAHPFLMRDLVAALLPLCGEVSVADWPNARYVPKAAGRFGLAENIVETAQMIRALGPEVHVAGVCQGALPAIAASSLLAEEGLAPVSLSLIGGPIDPARAPTNLMRAMRGRSMTGLESQLIEKVPVIFPGMGRKVFPARRQMQTFAVYLWRQAMTGGELPLRLTLDEGADPLTYPLSRLCWTMMDLPGEFFLENIAALSGSALAAGVLEVDGRTVRPAALGDTALLTVEGSADDIAMPGQTIAAHDLCPSVPPGLHFHLTLEGAGHFSLFYGRRMREEIVPAIGTVMAAGLAARQAGSATSGCSV